MDLLRLRRAAILMVALCLMTGHVSASADEPPSRFADYGTLRVPVSVLADPEVGLEIREQTRGSALGVSPGTRPDPGQEYFEFAVTGRVLVFLSRGEHRGRTISTFYPGVASADDATLVDVRLGETVTLPAFKPLIGATAQGTVTTSDGSPLRGRLEVRGYSIGRDGRLGDPQRADVGTDGRFTVEGLQDGPAIFQAVGEGDADRSPRYSPYAPTWSGDVRSEDTAHRSVVARNRTNDVGTITMIDEGTLSGRAVDADGQPVVGAIVTSDGFRGELVTDIDGRWDAGGVSAGRYSVGISDPHENVYGTGRTVDVVSGRPTLVDTTASFSRPTWAVSPTWDAEPYETPQGRPITISPGVLNQPDARITDITWVMDGGGSRAIVVGRGLRYTPPPGLSSWTQLYAVMTAERRGMKTTSIVDNAEIRDAARFEDLMTKTDRRTVVHEVVSAGARPSASTRETRRWQWLRDGKPISSATARTYRASPKDRGHRLSVRTAVRRPDERVTRRTSRSTVVRQGSTIITPNIVPVEDTRLLATASIGVSNVDRRYADGTVVVQRLDESGPVDVARFPVRDGWGGTRFASHRAGSIEYRMVFTPSESAMSDARSVDIPVPGIDQHILFADSPWSRSVNNQIFGIDEGPE